jgi:protein-L-isoaspartate(D-aspartate) O-methyltransferase
VADRIVEAFESVDRQGFVPDDRRQSAYEDRPIALPKAQTTSQPSLIARMIDATSPRPTDRALEVGTGFGFQTALLARLVDRVYSIERHAELAEAARSNLERAGETGVEIVVGDGWEGLPERAPFDLIVVSASANVFPQRLGDQLAGGGRMVVPLAGAFGDDVVVFVKRASGVERERLVTPARFVPLVKGTA